MWCALGDRTYHWLSLDSDTKRVTPESMPLTTEPSYCLIQEHSITVIIKETQTKGYKEFEEEKQTSSGGFS